MSKFDKKEYISKSVLNIRMENIRTIACEFYKIRHVDFHRRSRKGNIPMARFLFYYMCNKFFNRYISQAEMGAWVGGYDHATARHGIQTFKNILDVNKELAKEVSHMCDDFKEMYLLDVSISVDREKILEKKVRDQRVEINTLYESCLELIKLHVPTSVQKEAIEMLKMPVNTIINTK